MTKQNDSGERAERADLAQLMRAAEAGNPKAQFNLALRYGRGEGVAEDQAEAVRLLCESAKQGFRPAEDVLSQIKQAVRQHEEDQGLD